MKKVLKLFRDIETNEVVYEEVELNEDIRRLNVGVISGLDCDYVPKFIMNLDFGSVSCNVIGAEVVDADGVTLNITNAIMGKVLRKLSGNVYIVKDDESTGIESLTDEEIEEVVNNLIIVGSNCYARVNEEKVMNVAECVLEFYQGDDGLVYSDGKRYTSVNYIGEGTHVINLDRLVELCQV